MSANDDLLLPAIADRLFIFDMDGTLLVETTASLEIAKATGTLAQLEALEKSFAARIIDAFAFAQQISALWGILDPAFIRRVFDSTAKLANIDAVTGLIRRGRGKSCLITMSPDFYAHHFYDHGFDFVMASQFPTTAETKIVREHILNPSDKAVIARRLCSELGFDLKRCVAFGDSMSDYLLFEELHHTVSVNGDPTLSRLARYRYEGPDLYAAITLACREILKRPRFLLSNSSD